MLDDAFKLTIDKLYPDHSKAKSDSVSAAYSAASAQAAAMTASYGSWQQVSSAAIQ